MSLCGFRDMTKTWHAVHRKNLQFCSVHGRGFCDFHSADDFLDCREISDETLDLAFIFVID